MLILLTTTTKGIGLTGDTGSTGNKYLKDGDISFAVTGDGSLVSTTATAAGVKVAVKFRIYYGWCRWHNYRSNHGWCSNC